MAHTIAWENTPQNLLQKWAKEEKVMRCKKKNDKIEEIYTVKRGESSGKFYSKLRKDGND